MNKTDLDDNTNTADPFEPDAAFLAEKQRIITERKAASQEKTNQQEIWRRIVVKIISWSDGLLSAGIIKPTDKITAAEWQVYCDKSIKINTGQDRKKIEQDLEETRKKIETHNGFEKK